MRRLVGPALIGVTALASAEEDIRDIRGPKTVPQSWLLPSVIGIAVFIAVCSYLYWRWRHRVVAKRAPSLSTETLERLDALRPLMSSATAREFAIAASEIMRGYIEQRFAVVATQRTTEEFLQSLLRNSDEALTRNRALLATFLQQCDFVKFAAASLSITHMESLLQSARGFVLETATASRSTSP